jgi:hypothetical protein
VRLARVVAISADLLQIGLFPLFGEGVLSVANDAVDVLVCAILVGLLGWHWAFLPGLLAEAVPALNLAPTWTAAVFLVTREGVREAPVPRGPVVDVEARPLDREDSSGSR